jgi:hypothetical protein
MKYTDTQRLDYYEANERDFRFIRGVTMDGMCPCWSYWSPEEGRGPKTRRKTLREAIDAALDNGGSMFFDNKKDLDASRPKS